MIFEGKKFEDKWSILDCKKREWDDIKIFLHFPSIRGSIENLKMKLKMKIFDFSFIKAESVLVKPESA